MKSIIAVIFIFVSTSAFASQNLDQAIALKPELGTMIDALEKVAGVECLTDVTFVSFSVQGPEGKKTVTHQSACYDPNAFNPSQIGQLMVSYYGDAQGATSPVGTVIDIKYNVFK